jgi:hypothetical protein
MNDDAKHERSAASRRTIECVTAIVLLVLGAVVIYDSVRIGYRWAVEGPQSGYFPFYIGLLLCATAVVIFVQAFADKAGGARSFVSRGGMKQVLTLLVPAAIYVALIRWLGIFVASALFIAFFMWWLGRYPVWKIVAVSAGVMTVFFVLLDLWFKLPLPKGPVEGFLGLL